MLGAVVFWGVCVCKEESAMQLWRLTQDCVLDINLHMSLQVQGCNEFKMPEIKYGSFHSNSTISKED